MVNLNKNRKLSNLIQEVRDNDNQSLSKFGISVTERKDRVSRMKSVIYLVLKYGSKTIKRSLQIYCQRGAFDPKTRTIKNDHSNTVLIQSICLKAERLVTDFRLTERELDPNLIMGLLLKECDLKDDSPTFYEVLEGFLREYKELEGVEYSRKTVNKVENSLKHIGSFLSEKFGTKQVTFQSIKPATANDFVHYCKAKKGFCNDSIRKLFGLCKRAFSVGLANGWCDHNAFTGMRFKHEKKPIQHLIESEIKLIQNAKFANEVYKETRDLIIFQCLTGLSYIDLYILNSTQLIQNENGLKYIFARRNKTLNEFAVLLTDRTLEIIERYKEHPVCKARGTCLPVPTNQQYNRVVKEIAKIVGIQKPLTTHVFRKTFATLMVNKGLSKESLQYCLAHQSVKMTEKHYAVLKVERVLEEQKAVFTRIA